MSRRYLVLSSVLLVVIALAIVACTSPGTGSSLFTSPIIPPPTTTTVVPPPIVARQDVEITFDLGFPIAMNKPVPITITVRSRVDLQGATVSFTVLGPKVTRYSPPHPLDNLKANQRTQIIDSLIFPEEAEYFIAVNVHTTAGFDKSESRRIRVTQDGVVINPTSVYGPGTPAPAAPVEPRATPLPTAIAPSPGASPTPFEGSGPAGRDARDANVLTAGSVTLRGHVWFEDRDHAQRSGKYMWVKVWDWMGPTPTADRFLGETMTDASGNWALGPITNSDPDGTRLDVYFTFETSTYGSTVPNRIVVRQNGSDYAWTTRGFPTWDIPDGDQWVSAGGVAWTTD